MRREHSLGLHLMPFAEIVNSFVPKLDSKEYAAKKRFCGCIHIYFFFGFIFCSALIVLNVTKCHIAPPSPFPLSKRKNFFHLHFESWRSELFFWRWLFGILIRARKSERKRERGAKFVELVRINNKKKWLWYWKDGAKVRLIFRLKCSRTSLFYRPKNIRFFVDLTSICLLLGHNCVIVNSLLWQI